MAENSSSSQPSGPSAGSPRPLKVAKPLPSAPTSLQREAASIPSEGGLARPVPLSAPQDQSSALQPELDPDVVAPSLRRPVPRRTKGKKKPGLAGWHIGLLAAFALLVIGGAAALMLNHDSADQRAARNTQDQARRDLASSPPVKTPSTAQPKPTTKDSRAAKGPGADNSDPVPAPQPLEPLTVVKFDKDAPVKPADPAPIQVATSGAGQEPVKPEAASGQAAAGQASGSQGSVSESASQHLTGRAYRREEEYKSYPNQKPIVDAGLNWLARHQLADGGWAFEHRLGECQGRCGNPGDLLNARLAATGFALLPFLGAGHSHLDGPYRRTVAGGLKYLMAHQMPRGGMVEQGGQMYGHGIATLALCEAFGVANERGGMGKGLGDGDYTLPKPDAVPLAPDEKKAAEREKKIDKALRIDPKSLKDAARRAVGVIIAAQHPEGGWRYYPGDAGDMSVVGWQIMALASAQQAGFGFDRGVRDRALNFMRLCGGNLFGDEHYGAVPTRFSYLPAIHSKGVPAATNATTAIGLLSMIYLGINPQHPGMEMGIQRLRQIGPNAGDMYYTYYANQVMYQHGGEAWEQWKQQTEQLLLPTQAKGDHLDGSWFLPGDHGSQKGGRVYCTVMALLCMEENYRHMRLFNNAIANQKGVPAPAPNNAGGLPNNAAVPPINAPGGVLPPAPAVVAPAQGLPPAVPQQGGGGDNLPAGGFNNGEAVGGAENLKPLDPGGG